MTYDEAELRARAAQVVAATARALAATYDMAAAAIRATASTQRFAEAIVRSEAREIAEHPDLAELNVRLDGFYEAG